MQIRDILYSQALGNEHKNRHQVYTTTAYDTKSKKHIKKFSTKENIQITKLQDFLDNYDLSRKKK